MREASGDQRLPAHQNPHSRSVLDVEENSLISPFFPSFLSSYTVKLLKTQTLLLWYSEPTFSHKWKTKTKTDIYIFPSEGKKVNVLYQYLRFVFQMTERPVSSNFFLVYFYISLLLLFLLGCMCTHKHRGASWHATLMESFLSFFTRGLLLSNLPWPFFGPLFFKLITKLLLLPGHKN